MKHQDSGAGGGKPPPVHYGGRRFRTSNILDEGVREELAIEIATSLRAGRVILALEQLKEWRGLPPCDPLRQRAAMHGAALQDWCAAQGVDLCYIQPCKLNQNACIERFNKTYRTEVLNAYVFADLDQVREISEAWPQRYNEERPHEALGNPPPSRYREALKRTAMSLSEVCP